MQPKRGFFDQNPIAHYLRDLAIGGLEVDIEKLCQLQPSSVANNNGYYYTTSRDGYYLGLVKMYERSSTNQLLCLQNPQI